MRSSRLDWNNRAATAAHIDVEATRRQAATLRAIYAAGATARAGGDESRPVTAIALRNGVGTTLYLHPRRLALARITPKDVGQYSAASSSLTELARPAAQPAGTRGEIVCPSLPTEPV